MAVNPISMAAIAAAGLIVLTCADAYRQRGTPAEPPTRRNAAYSAEAVAIEPSRCAIDHAQFGGQRAQLIKVMRGNVANYVVLEVGKRDPLMRARRTQWLRAAYGEAEHVWLGEYSSADAALARAAQFCPPAIRCWPGDADCGRRVPLLTPAQAFFGR